MNKTEYLEYLQTHAGWAPGWLAIQTAFGAVYGNAAPAWVGADQVRAGPSPLDGFGVYRSQKGYVHIVTRGLTQIAAAADAFAATRSGWGFELTAKCSPDAPEQTLPVLQLLERLSRYTETRKAFLYAYKIMPLAEKLDFRMPSPEAFAAVALIPDTEIPPRQTVHGLVEFLQIVQLSERELTRIGRYPSLLRQILFEREKDNPDMIISTD